MEWPLSFNHKPLATLEPHRLINCPESSVKPDVAVSTVGVSPCFGEIAQNAHGGCEIARRAVRHDGGLPCADCGEKRHQGAKGLPGGRFIQRD